MTSQRLFGRVGKHQFTANKEICDYFFISARAPLVGYAIVITGFSTIFGKFSFRRGHVYVDSAELIGKERRIAGRQAFPTRATQIPLFSKSPLVDCRRDRCCGLFSAVPRYGREEEAFIVSSKIRGYQESGACALLADAGSTRSGELSRELTASVS